MSQARLCSFAIICNKWFHVHLQHEVSLCSIRSVSDYSHFFFYSFITLADCWGCNKEAFLAASAFIGLQLMRQGDTDENAGNLF